MFLHRLAFIFFHIFVSVCLVYYIIVLYSTEVSTSLFFFFFCQVMHNMFFPCSCIPVSSSFSNSHKHASRWIGLLSTSPRRDCGVLHGHGLASHLGCIPPHAQCSQDRFRIHRNPISLLLLWVIGVKFCSSKVNPMNQKWRHPDPILSRHC